MTILALDTTTDLGSVAVWSDGTLIRAVEMMPGDGYSTILFNELEKLAREGTVRFEKTELFAAAAGPGSFTGVRVGLATVKALAEATGAGALGISNLQALASVGTGPLRAVLLNARRGECYAAVYDGDLQLVEPETVAEPADWISALPPASYQFIAQQTAWLEPLLAPTRFAGSPVLEAPSALASAIARCAALQIERGVSTDPVTLDANYVRRSDVNLYWHDR